ncbi:MAG: helix-turn-helix domain-containing protein [Lentisphaeria bacterium]|nr:helix-turn-helix domain-containing protein [Lentisphaeria bacterium]
MEFFPAIDLAAPAAGLIRAAENLERRYGICFTVHDLHGVLFGRTTGGFPGIRYRHNHPFCRNWRRQFPGDRSKCRRSCNIELFEVCRMEERPLLHRCWRGATQLVVPIFRRSELLLILYAGMFRREGDEPCGGIPENRKREFYELPLLDRGLMAELATELELWGAGLLFYSESSGDLLRRSEYSSLRHNRIRRFFAQRAHEPVTIRDLAEELHLSPSRVGSILKAEFGMTFLGMQTRERMLRACRLLVETDHPLEWIANALGYRNVFYFNRVFTARQGTPPGRFRREHSARTQTPES